MQVESPEKIRNLAVVGHGDTGKTTLVSALLYTERRGQPAEQVEDGNTTPTSIPRRSSGAARSAWQPASSPWKSTRSTSSTAPAPGSSSPRAKAGMRAADAALLCVNGVAGIEVTTENAWRVRQRIELPVLIHLTKMDRERAELRADVAALQERFGREVVPVQLPIGSEHDFNGVVDLIEREGLHLHKDGDGKAKAGEIPGEMADRGRRARERADRARRRIQRRPDGAFFEAGTLTHDELREGCAPRSGARKIFPSP